MFLHEIDYVGQEQQRGSICYNPFHQQCAGLCFVWIHLRKSRKELLSGSGKTDAQVF
jgi:hypothetical protein